MGRHGQVPRSERVERGVPDEDLDERLAERLAALERRAADLERVLNGMEG